MKFTLFRADCCGNAGNSRYPTEVSAEDADTLKAAAAFDHVCARYRNSHRSNDDFLSSNVVVMDFDNDQSDDPEDWITEEKLDKLMPDISYALVPSRHHMAAKGGKAPRPKYHVYFPIEAMTDPAQYSALKRGIQKVYPFFDDNALDAARFVYGSNVGEVVWHEGWVNIDEDVQPDTEVSESSPTIGGTIPAGSRNNTMSRFAGRVTKRFGVGDKAHGIFLREAAKCDPPLPESELDSIWASATRFYHEKVQSQEGYIEPDQYNADFGEQSLRPKDFSDVGEATVLAREYGNELFYTDATGYLRYDGIRWNEESQTAVAAMQEFTSLQMQDALDELSRAKEALIQSGVAKDIVDAGGKALEKAIDGETQRKLVDAFLAARQYLAFAMKYRDYRPMTAAINAAKPMLLGDVSDLDKDAYLLNTPDGTYDLRHGVAGKRDHSSGDLITKVTACSPGDKGEREWQDALDLFFCGDQKLIDYVQRVVGLAAIGKVLLEFLIICYGIGANGKSTFWNTIARVLGAYSGKLSADTLTAGCRRNVKAEMAELKGKRLVIASETEEGMRLSTSVVKQLCATDDIYAEKKYKDPFSFTPSHTLVLYTNHLPKVGASDEGIWRRLVVIPFNAHITGDSDIKNYSDYLFEHAGPAILKWILEGSAKVISENFHIDTPQCVSDAIAGYREDNDWLGAFLEACCDVAETNQERSGELYVQYRAYCAKTGEWARGTSDFYGALKQAGFGKHKTNRGIFVSGLSLKCEDDFLE